MKMLVAVAAAAVIVASASPALAQKKPTLAEAAKAREQQKAAPETKVYTNKDLPKVAPAPVAKTVDAKTPAKPEPAAATAPAPKDPRLIAGKDEGYWKERMRVLVVKLDDDTGAQMAAQRRVYELGSEGAWSRGLTAFAVNAERLRAESELSRLTGIVMNDRRTISDLEEEARRAGVPPGWLRLPIGPATSPSPR